MAYMPYVSNDPYWVDWGDRALDIVGARYGEGRYYSPDDPRFDPQQAGGYGYPSAAPVVYTPQGPALSPGAVSAQGFQLNWWTAALLGVVVGAFLLGKRGR